MSETNSGRNYTTDPLTNEESIFSAGSGPLEGCDLCVAEQDAEVKALREIVLMVRDTLELPNGPHRYSEGFHASVKARLAHLDSPRAHIMTAQPTMGEGCSLRRHVAGLLLVTAVGFGVVAVHAGLERLDLRAFTYGGGNAGLVVQLGRQACVGVEVWGVPGVWGSLTDAGACDI